MRRRPWPLRSAVQTRGHGTASPHPARSPGAVVRRPTGVNAVPRRVRPLPTVAARASGLHTLPLVGAALVSRSLRAWRDRHDRPPCEAPTRTGHARTLRTAFIITHRRHHSFVHTPYSHPRDLLIVHARSQRESLRGAATLYSDGPYATERTCRSMPRRGRSRACYAWGRCSRRGTTRSCSHT
jgi:hypothetical protein